MVIELSDNLRRELIDVLANVPSLRDRAGRNAWLLALPRDAQNQIVQRDENVKRDLSFIIDSVQSLRLKDGRWIILILLENLMNELSDLKLSDDIRKLREKTEADLVQKMEYFELGPYKILNITSPVPSIVDTPSTFNARIQLLIDGDVATFDGDTLINALSGILAVSSEKIKIVRVLTGSIKVDLEMPLESARKLYQYALMHLKKSNSEMSNVLSSDLLDNATAESSEFEITQTTDTKRQQWLKQIGFTRDPFHYTDGANDPYLKEYFYLEMKYFNNIFDVDKPSNIFVFGPPGSGKSSLRNVISQIGSKQNKIFPIVYKDFGILVGKQSEKITAEEHVAQVLKTALRVITDKIEKKNIMVINESSQRSRMICNQLWTYVSTYEEDPLEKQTLKNFLAPDVNVEGTLPVDARELLERFCRYITELFGYQSVYILVDPDDIDSDDDVAWHVLEPLLLARRLLEFSENKHLFKFFLNQKFRSRVLGVQWIREEWERRCYDLEWPEHELRNLLTARLKACSNKARFSSLGELSDDIDLDNKIVNHSIGSPRKLILICDRLFSLHCRNWSQELEEPLFITNDEVNEVLKHFEKASPKSPEELRLSQWLEQDEHSRLEFKSTMRYNRKAKRLDKEMEREIAGTICAFMNTEGGTLLIGIDDEKNVLGLDEDFSTLGKRQNKDGFIQAFINITENLFDPPILPNSYSAYFIESDNKLVYVIEVNKSEKPIFCIFDNSREFYIRKQNTSRKLDSKDTLEYCLEHF